MPFKPEKREYRMMPVLMPTTEKRIESDYYVEGYATTFDQPYLLYKIDDREYKEVIDRNALNDADVSDVLFQYNHGGRVFARNKMKKGKKPTLILEAQRNPGKCMKILTRALYIRCPGHLRLLRTNTTEKPGPALF